MQRKKTLLMAADLGTSFIKTAVYDLNSKLLAEASAPVISESPEPGIFIQKGEDIIQALVECMADTVQKLGDEADYIAAIGFSGQMSGCIGVDENWNDITTWSCSMDSRYMPYAETLLKEHGDRFMAVCGTSSPCMAPKYMWFKDAYPEKAGRIRKYLGIIGYAIGKLGNCAIEDAVLDSTVLQWTGLGDLEKGEWSEELCEYVQMDKNLLPQISHSTDICGYLSKEMAKKIGLKEGIALVSGAGDKIAGCIGANIVHPNEAIFEAASYGAVTVRLNAYRPDMETGRFDMIPSAIPNEFYCMNFIIGSGMTLDWFHKIFSDGCSSTKEDFNKLDELVAQIAPGSDGVMAIGLLGGSAFPVDSSYKGLWMGFDWSHKKEHLYRAMLESISYEFALAVKRVEEMYPDLSIENIKVIGGGAKSKVWNQINADVMGKEYHKLNRDDVALWGAAMLGGAAIGVIDDIKTEGAKHVHTVEVYKPNMERHRFYKEKVKQYKELLTGLKPFFADLHKD